MKTDYPYLPQHTIRRRLVDVFSLLLLFGVLGACGGGAGTTALPPVATIECNPDDSSTHSECGTLMVSLTDADGDFLNYTVDITSLTLETANGRTIETLPQSTRINFTDYVDLSELVTTASIPPAVYVAGTIGLDYSDAEVFVEDGDTAKQTVVTDVDGNPLTQTQVKIRLSNRDQLRITRGRPAILQLDFDLQASHTVDIVPTPAIAVAEPFILAEVTPVDEKDIRVRGSLLEVDPNEMTYSVSLRPFHGRLGNNGRVTVQVSDDTEFDVNGDSFVGSDGLRALNEAGQSTLTVAQGTLNVAEREFTAAIVLAGSSVPGAGSDAVVGNIIARDGNFLTVRGATLIPSDRRAHFHDDVVVEVGPDTKVRKDGNRLADLNIDALSIGQRVTIRGAQAVPTTAATAPQVTFDATAGSVRLHITHLLGLVNTVLPGQTDITLHGIDRRRVQIFDFSGTGASADLDADPDNYEIATGNLTVANFAAGKPVVAYGFPSAFGAAPTDFDGRTLIDYTEVRSALGVGWGSAGTTAPFLSADSDGLLLNNQNTDIDQRHYIKQGPLLIDLTELDSDTRIVPRETGRALFYLKSADSLRQYSDFDDFVTDLSNSLDGATTARSLHARGRYDAASNTLTAYKIGMHLIEP